MAAPQTHGTVTVIIFMGLSALGLIGKITIWEYLSVIFWGFLIDLDHLISWKYVKDLPDRIFKRGGGAPQEGADFVSWLHIWPGLLLVWAWGFVFNNLFPGFKIWLPFPFWLIHIIIDYFQRSDGKFPHYHFLYPLIKRKYFRKKGYPIKVPAEFIIGGFILLIICFAVLGFLVAR